MAAKRLPMRQIRNVLKLRYEQKLSQRGIARACGIGNGTVSELLNRAQAKGLTWPLPADLDDTALEALLYPPPVTGDEPARPDLAWVDRELKRPGVTRSLLWLEFIQERPGGVHYSRFCELYAQYRKVLNPTMRQSHTAGEKTYVDYSGKRPEIVDPKTGEVTPVELFVGVLGASNLTYVEAVATQGLDDWIGAHLRMFEYFGGCSQILVPDNLASGVTKTDRFDPIVNRTYEDMAAHYGVVVIPARVAKPKDKPKVEGAVLIAQRWILARLRNRVFFSLAELNAAIRDLLVDFNNRPMQKLGISRRELFEEVERSTLLPLPNQRYELARWKICRVNIDYHIELGRNYYSVPYQLLKKSVEVRYTGSTIEVFLKGKRVASHPRLNGRGHCSTLADHMPSSHRAYAEWTPSRLISWGKKIGPFTGRIIAQILESRPHPEQGFRSSRGLLGLERTYGAERLEAASRRALELGVASLQTVKNILSTGSDQRALTAPDEEQLSMLPDHENVRGREYYN